MTDGMAAVAPAEADARMLVRTAATARRSVVIEDDEVLTEEDDQAEQEDGETHSDAARGNDVGLTPSDGERFSQAIMRRQHGAARASGAAASCAAAAAVAQSAGGGSLLQFLGSSANVEELLLPHKSGHLEKLQPRWLGAWQPRWFVLDRKRLRWFSGPDDKEALGCLDFDLVPCEVEQLWDESVEDEKSAAASSLLATYSKRRSFCGGCDPLTFLVPQETGVRFRLCPVGSDRAFELHAPSKTNGKEWVDALALHIKSASVACNTPRQLVTPCTGRRWWKVTRISPRKLEQVARTGDILLFRSRGTMPKIIRAASGGGRFDHVGLLLRLENDSLALLEATGSEGVGVVTWHEFVMNEWHLLYPILALRRVAFQRSPQRMAELQEWCSEVIGKPYSLTINKLMQRKSITEGGEATDQAFFCSQLVAEALKVLGVVPRGLSSTQFWPASFDASHRPAIATTEDASLEDQLIIDFSLEPTEKATEVAGGAGGRERDATTAWK